MPALLVLLSCDRVEPSSDDAVTTHSDAGAAASSAGAGGVARPAAGSGGHRTDAGGGAGGVEAGSGGGGAEADSGGSGPEARSGGAGGTAVPSTPAAGRGSAGASAAPGDPDVLEQKGNPIYDQLTRYQRWLSSEGDAGAKLAADRMRADNMLTWQLPHGGFYKNDIKVYDAKWNGSDSRAGWTGESGVELGTIDNNATVSELLFLADVYQRSSATEYRDGARKAFDFLLKMQLPSGGFPQVYPARTGTSYSNYVTFNDDAMARVLVLLQQATQQAPPLQGELLSDKQRADAQLAIERAVQYILAAQIEQDGKKTVWCAQHDPTSYEPRGARSYELPSKSGSESAGVIAFLMTQPQTPAVRAAVMAALAWFASPAVMRKDTAYVTRPEGSTDDSYDPIQARAGSTMWCRFYELDRDDCFFSGRLPTDDPPGKGKQANLMDIEPERRYGYQWGGSYGSKLLTYAKSVGY
ncbi:MAG TPA: pectate lyase [Polyangiales bacterium]|nr:pectate lyase [Polyangiales bacterium]